MPPQASAFCIDLNDFCDEFDLDIDTGTLYGWWDANCDRAFRQGQLGCRRTTNSGLKDWVGLYFGVASTIEWDFAALTFSFYV